MRLLPRDKITVGDRQRHEIDKSKLVDLRDSILARGLLHPPVVREANGSFTLVAGGRRLAAIDQIAESKSTFLCNRETILPGFVPVTFLADLSPSELLTAEFDENEQREALPWTDRVRALADIHARRCAEAPEDVSSYFSHSFSGTAKDLIDKGTATLLPRAGSEIAATATAIREATIVAKHLDDPTIRKARNASEAFSLVMAKEEAAFRRVQIERRTAAAGGRPTLIEVRHGNSLEILPRLDSGLADLIASDPPYGIDAGAAGARSRTVHHHNYQDTPESARAICQAIVLEGFRICKARANLFLFTDIDHFDWLRSVSARAGWDPFRTPIIWAKSDSEGMAPWGRSGFRRTYEIIFYATKGKRGLISSPIDILRFNRVARAEREYGAEKPLDLMRLLIECSTLPNDFVLDPCMGSGSTLVAARNSGRQGLGIEIDEGAYNIALKRVNDIASEEEPEPAKVGDL